MKKVLLTAALVALFGWANAQTEEGSMLVSATSNLGFTSSKADGANERGNVFFLNTSAGYFVIDNLTAGLNLGFSSFSQGDISSNAIQIGPFARYYVNGIFFLGASYSFESGKTSNSFSENTFNREFLGLEAGYPIWLVDNVAIEPAFVYQSQKSDDFGDVNSFGINVGFSLYF